jgi:hypothetical protein
METNGIWRYSGSLPATGKQLSPEINVSPSFFHSFTEKQQNSNGSRLWDKLMQATQSVADKIPNRDDKGPGML